MAVTLTALGTTQRITLSGTANNVTEVILPPFANMLEVQFVANDGKIAITGTDGAAIGTNYFTANADTLYRREVFNRTGVTTAQKRYLASATSSCVVEVTPLRSSLLVAGEAGGGGGGGGVTSLQTAYAGGATIATAGAVDLAVTLTSGNFVVNGGGAVDLGSTGTDLSSFSVGATAWTVTGTSSSTLEMVANSASNRTLTINATNVGAGNGNLDINVDNAVTLDGASIALTSTGNSSMNAGGTVGINGTAITIGGTLASSISTTAANLSLLTITSGTLKLESAADLAFIDGNKSGSTYAGTFKLSAASSEWSTFDTNFGEVSILNAINACYAKRDTQNIAFTIATTGASDSWTNQPAAVTEFLGATNRRVQADLSRASEARCSVNIGVVGNTGSTVSIQYSTDSGSTWAYLDGSAGPSCSIASIDNVVGSWVTLASGAKADVLLRIVGAGGNAVADPSFRRITLETR